MLPAPEPEKSVLAIGCFSFYELEIELGEDCSGAMAKEFINETIKDIVNFFDLGEVLDVVRLNGNANDNYDVMTEKGSYIVKIISEHPKEDVETELLYLDRLKEYDFSGAYYIQNSSGECVYSKGNILAVALLKIETASLHDHRAIYGEIGKMLAILHCIPSDSLPSRNHWLRQPYIASALDRIKEAHPNEYDLLKREYDSLADFPYGDLPQSIVHGDIHEYNLIFDGKRIILLDWEEVGVAPSVLDLGVFIFESFKNQDFDEELFTCIISEYETRRKLTERERSILPFAVRYARLTNTVWRLLKTGKYVCYPDISDMTVIQ